MKIALVNCLALPEPDPDEAPLLHALRQAGHHAEPAAWDDAGVDWSRFDGAVIRATWNYHRNPDAFEAWVESVSTRTTLLNPPELIRWNLHKRYLKHFEDRRLPIVPTLWGTGEADAAVGGAIARGWTKIVVKPCVSAGSRDTRVFDIAQGATNDDAFSFARDLQSREDIMVQRYLPSVASGGESSIIAIGGQLSHAIQKFPRFAGQDEHVGALPEIGHAERRFAEAVLETCPFDPLYARVDIMLDESGGVVLSELELIEPSLYFDLGPGSAERMVRAIEAALA